MNKIIWPVLIRHFLVVAITFLATKGVLSHEVADKMNRGDTVELWSGAWSFNLAMIQNVLIGVAAPVLIPLVWGVTSKLISSYKALVARVTPKALTAWEVNDVTATKGLITMAQSVSAEKIL